MTKFFFICGTIAVFLAAYALVIRPWLKEKSWAAWFFRLIEPVESVLFKKSETILWARFQQLLGMLGVILPTIGAIDTTPFTTFVDDKYKAIVAALPGICLAINGFITELLRRSTTKPLEVVSAPENAPPAVKAAVEQAEVATEKAVAAVEKAK